MMLKRAGKQLYQGAAQHLPYGIHVVGKSAHQVTIIIRIVKRTGSFCIFVKSSS